MDQMMGIWLDVTKEQWMEVMKDMMMVGALDCTMDLRMI